MAIQSSFYSGTALDSRTFPSTKHIATKQHMAVWRQQVLDDVWVQVDITDYQLINNTCVLNQLLSQTLYKQLEVRVADDLNELVSSPSDTSIVASIQAEVVTVAGIQTEVVTVAGIQTEIVSLYNDKVTLDSLYADKATLDSLYADKATLDSLYTDKATLDSLYADKATLDSLFADKATLDSLYADKATLDSLYADKATLDSLYADKATLDTIYANLADINTVATNIVDVQNADANATTAKLKAWESEAEALTADSYATEAEDIFVKTYTSNGDGTFIATDTTDYSSLHYSIKSAASSDIPIGYIAPSPSGTVFINHLECDGSELSRTTYANLYSVIGDIYGAGDGSTTFNIPDLRGEFIRGFDNGRGVDSGRTIGTWQVDDFKSHQHSLNWWGNNGGAGAGTKDLLATGDGFHPLDTSLVGGTETRPRNIAMMYCIKY